MSLYEKEVNIVAAMDSRGVIGKVNGNGVGEMPWPPIHEDMRKFVDLTKECTVIPGRKTWESLSGNIRTRGFDRGRETIVVSRNPSFNIPVTGVKTATSLEMAIKTAERSRVFIIGGSEVYRAALQYADFMYITRIYWHFQGNVYFPEYNTGDWLQDRPMQQIKITCQGERILVRFFRYMRKRVPLYVPPEAA